MTVPAPVEISLILSCRDGLPYLAEQLESLAAQEDPGRWELIVVDNGSTDGSATVAAMFADRLPLTVVSAPEVANISFARNRGAREARSDRLAFVDADDRLGPHWVRAMREGLAWYALVAGVLQPDSSSSTRSAAAATLPNPAVLSPHIGEEFLPYAQGCAVGVQRRWFDAVGGFDIDLGWVQAEDVGFSWDVQLAGGDFALLPEAVVEYRSRADLRSALKQQYRVGRAQALLFSRYGGRGMPRSRPAVALSRWIVLVASLPLIPFSARLRGRWSGTASRRMGRVAGSLRYRVLYF